MDRAFLNIGRLHNIFSHRMKERSLLIAYSWRYKRIYYLLSENDAIFDFEYKGKNLSFYFWSWVLIDQARIVLWKGFLCCFMTIVSSRICLSVFSWWHSPKNKEATVTAVSLTFVWRGIYYLFSSVNVMRIYCWTSPAYGKPEDMTCTRKKRKRSFLFFKTYVYLKGLQQA